MIKLILLFCLICTSLPAHAGETIQFTPSFKKKSLINHAEQHAFVYRPTKLLIGTNSKFLVKAEPDSFISLALSTSNKGAEPVYGKKLRLGKDIKNYEGKIPKKGLLEINVDLPDDKELNGKFFYFEVLVWKRHDFKDLSIAKIIAPNGKQIDFNGIKAALPKGKAGTKLRPAVPGAEFIETMYYIEKLRSGQEINEYEFNNNINAEPVMLQNLRSPDLKKED